MLFAIFNVSDSGGDEWKRGCNRFWSKMAAFNDLKWYSTFFFLIGAILSFTDPVTDAFTLAEYYKDNHMRWFKWGGAFHDSSLSSLRDGLPPDR